MLKHLFISPICDSDNTVLVLFYNAIGSEWVTIGILPEKYGSADPAAQRGFSSDEPLYNSAARHAGELEERSGSSCAGKHLSTQQCPSILPFYSAGYSDYHMKGGGRGLIIHLIE